MAIDLISVHSRFPLAQLAAEAAALATAEGQADVGDDERRRPGQLVAPLEQEIAQAPDQVGAQREGDPAPVEEGAIGRTRASSTTAGTPSGNLPNSRRWPD
jgi:hypothetical protein